MARVRFFAFRLFSSRFLVCAAGLTVVAVVVLVWSPWRGNAQSPLKTPPYRGASGHVSMSPHRVAFKAGPIGPDGKVHQLPPQHIRFMPEAETEEAEAAQVRAAAGIFDLTSKPRARVLSPEELKALNWNPTQLHLPGGNAGQLGTASSKKEVTARRNSAPAAPSQSANGFPGSGWTGQIPPDGGVAAGHFDIVAVVNNSVNVWDKNGDVISSTLLSDLFAPVGVSAQDFITDPVVIFDPDFDRFFLVTMSENDTAKRSTILLAVSAADDVHEGWDVFAFDATLNGNTSTNNWCDHPQIGIDSVAIYVTCNMFEFPFNEVERGPFQYSKVRILSKDELLSGPCCSWWDFWNLPDGPDSSVTAFSVRPAVMHFSRDTDGEFLIGAGGRGGTGSAMHVWQVTNAANCCNGSTTGPTLSGVADDSVFSYGVAPAAAQPNGVQGIDTGDTRLLFATWEFGHLSVGQTTACSQNGTVDACAVFTEIDVSKYPSMSNVNDWILGEPAGTDVYYPYVEQNSNADKMMVYTRSDGSVTHPGAYAAPIPRSSTCTVCIGNETTLQAGARTYLNTDAANLNRWGDYHGAAADPDFLGIWVEGEYVSNGSPNTWSTWILPAYNTYSPIDSFSPSSLAFGNQAVFSSSASQEVVFTNSGNATLNFFKASITGDTDFLITDDGCSNQHLLAGSSCHVYVSFNPTVVGNASGALSVPDNAPDGAATVPLSGTGVQAGTSTSVTSSPNPSTFKQSVTLTAQVLPSTTGTPTGTVTFNDGKIALGTKILSGGAAKFTTSGLGGGTHSIFATYNGNTDFAGSSSTVLSQVVNPAQTITTLTSSQAASTFGQGITFTSKVTSGVGTPNGSVSFKNGAATLGTVSLASGTATFTTSSLSAGSHSITAVYTGTADFASSTSKAVTETVKKAATRTALASSLNPSSFGQSVTFSASVSPQFGGTVTGTIIFKDGDTTLGSRTVSGGKASLTLSNLHAGNHSITAIYDGSTDFLNSTSATVTQVVHKANTKTALTSSPNPSTSGQAVTFTATITANFTGRPTGTVTFRDNTTATVLGTGAVNSSGHASFTTSKLTVGTHAVKADYGGDTNFNSSTSATHNQVVE
jgi:hypothetical protein